MAVFKLTPVPPFRLDLTIWVLRRLPINQMDRWDGKTYRRVLMLADTPVEIAVVQAGSARANLRRRLDPHPAEGQLGRHDPTDLRRLDHGLPRHDRELHDGLGTGLGA